MYAPLKRSCIQCSRVLDRRAITHCGRSSAARTPPRMLRATVRQSTAEARDPEKLNSATPVPPATSQQLQRHFWISAVPFIGFGFMDNTVMIQAGNAIDCSIGVVLGLSTLAAAAIGQIISSGVSVTFGGYVETMARKAGLPSAGFTSAQRQLVSVRRVAMAGNLFGVVIGAALGLVNLLLIDTDRSANLKMEALTEEQEFAFEVEASNKKRNDATVLTVKGPDVDGLIASMTAALAESGLKLVELHAGSRSSETDWIEDVFVVKTRGAKKGQVDDADLDDLARKMLAASRDPLSAHTLKTQVRKLQAKNDRLRERVEKLVKRLEDQHITIEIDSWEQEGHDDEN
mmetsp:Transcript_23174/g.42020  ORF Transcript_23174/g.42020 Transcript_23174/m.42020 type:complete len:345 (+) Transcript_23174:161-1195(+)|eukprot:CAMPEP_0202504788 /NCGR_PEP_ID=MMETSP1361-20130828/45591_1 /ASSEMBLY_ACC=CAM_ASM_000849 /TAXON_ID=210615 /ORGANISM="Staurosira complex sp., Strain CCMP2646" /LENGTH=344 /DNA_ID=CAMNT_0049138393 /DNA_START=153 /DNA_END=1187 /DNA_ORIENTATION=+